ncbi:MAG: bifunctional 2',3'-cyclic-nucleotide 2'-phosphodiesterase/3'-nucleotidase [Treponemataceae bacterium]
MKTSSIGSRRSAVVVLFAFVAFLSFGQTVDFTVLATSDVHNNYLNYDYFSDMPTETYGLVKLAAAVTAERQTKGNVVLFDNGDNFQGNPFGEYLSKNPPKKGQTSPIMKLMNAMNYDAMTLGNHEFNFGLGYLASVLAGAQFPVVNANVVKAKAKNETPYFTPYTILTRTFKDRDGKAQTIKIGVTGVVPPQITAWDGLSLTGKVETRDMYESVAKYVPEMKKKGADIVVVLAHTGIVDFARKGGEENTGYYMTQIPGVDVVITGHAHMKFPSAAFAKISGVNLEKGTINGVAVVMPGSFADNLGSIELTVEKKGSAWTRVDSKSRLIPAFDSAKKQSLLAADASLALLLIKEHEGSLAYIRAPIGGGDTGGKANGELLSPLTSFFALVRDDYSVQIINEAQTWYAPQALKNTPYAKLPVLSAAAPFKAGGRQGPKYYTNVPAGILAVKNIADLYVYSNTVAMVKLTGAEVKEWLEMSAGQFLQIDPAKTEEQILINDKFPTYNYDVIDGVSYEIDVTKPNRYNEDGTLKDGNAERIRNLSYKGAPIDPKQEFVVATNNYRAYGGGNFPGVKPAKIIFASPDESRQVILKYIEAKKKIDPKPDGNWKLSPIGAAGPVVFFTSPAGVDALPSGIKSLGTVETGYGKYQLEK